VARRPFPGCGGAPALTFEQEQRGQCEAEEEWPGKIAIVDDLLVELGAARPEHRLGLGVDVREIDPKLLQNRRLVRLALPKQCRRQIPGPHADRRPGRVLGAAAAGHPARHVIRGVTAPAIAAALPVGARLP
jgi:hypothetical protein